MVFVILGLHCIWVRFILIPFEYPAGFGFLFFSLRILVERLVFLPFAGLYKAAHKLGIEWIVIKGVSDFADGKKAEGDPWRPFSSLMAASLTAHILSNAITFQDWPHYSDEGK